mgnify:CR=1 FL=1
MLEPVEQKQDEQHRTDNADNQLNRKLIREDDDSAQDVADEHEERTEKRCVKNRAANPVAFVESHHIRNDKPDVGD